MAKIYGLNGVLRGRQGNNVFSVQNGTQVVKAYQPVVSNPRTIYQREQRAKFALAGKISGATPIIAISGMNGASAREKRARFVSLITRAAAVTGSSDDLIASIGFSSILWSEGSLSRWSSSFSATAQYNQNNIVCTISAMTIASGAPAGYGEMVVVGLFDSESRPLDEVQFAVRGTSSSLTFTFRETPTRVDASVAVWVCPFVNEISRGAGRFSSLYPTENDINLRVTSPALAGVRYWGASQSVSVISVVPATTSIAPRPVETDDDNR